MKTNSQYILFSGYTGFLYKSSDFLLVLIRTNYIMKTIKHVYDIYVMSIVEGGILLTNTVEIMSVELVIAADPSIKIVQSIGSVLHGVLMEVVGTEYAGQLHESGLRPYSQYIYFDKDKKQLKISTVTKNGLQTVDLYGKANTAMAVEKLAEGIRKFAVDQEKLEAMLSAKL